MHERRQNNGTDMDAPRRKRSAEAIVRKRAPYISRNGTWYEHKLGYIVRNGANGRIIFQHREVMAEMLGRPLLRSENVHHLNGDRADNRPENLELWSTVQPKGQRVADKVAWAREILSLYGDDF